MAARKLQLYRSLLVIVLIMALFFPLNSAAQDNLHFQKGMAFPTWHSEEYCSSDSDESLRLLAQNTCTEWVQLVPTWYQQDRYSHEIFPDLKEQALCYQAVIRVFNGKPWLAGIYWWNWEPDPRRGGVLDKGYTPQGKPAEIVLKRWYCQLSKKWQKKR